MSICICSSDFIQVFLPVIEEIPVDTEIVCIFIPDFSDGNSIETENFRIRKGEEEGGMGSDNELDISPADELAQQLVTVRACIFGERASPARPAGTVLFS